MLMPGASGLELLEELEQRGEDAPIIVIMTAQNTFENAIEAMKRGAFDYLTKPFDLRQIEAVVAKALRLRELRGQLQALRKQLDDPRAAQDVMVGSSPGTVETFKAIGRISTSDVDVLLRGESGTGKELVARTIHRHSRRHEGPFVAVNMSAIPSELIEAELFGHERGAFTGAVESQPGRFRDAAGGTLLLDEIGDLPLALQAKLLRVLQEREVTPVGGRYAIPVDVRILAATHRDLESRVRDGSFRQDLYFRLNVVPIRIAPLRERPEDIPDLVVHFVERFGRELGVRVRWPTQAAIEHLCRQPWPGNVRELQNVIKRALVLAAGDVIDTDEVRAALDPATAAGPSTWTEAMRCEAAGMLESPDRAPDEGVYWSFVARVEEGVIREALEQSGGNQIQAARRLGINRNTLRKKIELLGLKEATARDSST
ncbi:MAG: sigma-54 dependent transcriptional regulator [Myxococcota bacterium]|nr:sigma-54 dependent transcriptional regulator [Myxococcota bacterium]